MRDVAAEDPKGSDEIAVWRETYASGPVEPAGRCPSEERIADLVVGEVAGDERTVLADHVVACPRCAETYRTLGELHEAATKGGRRGERKRTGKGVWLLAGVAAAVLVAAFGLAVLDLRDVPDGNRVVRGTDAGELDTEPADGARLATAPNSLSWSSHEEEPGGTYRVVLYDAEAVPLWRSDLVAEPIVEIPARIRKALPPGTYYWRIRTDRDLDRRETPLLRFEIRR